MPTNVNTATAKNTNTINVKVTVGDIKKKKPRRRAAPSTSDDSPPPPSTNVVQNTTELILPDSYPGPRSGGSMSNRPYDVPDGGVGAVQEAVPSGLASNYAAFQDSRARYFMSLQEQMQELLGSDSTDQTVAPPNAQDVPQHGAQPQEQESHRAEAFSAPPTREVMETQTPSALPAGPSRAREQRNLREAMLDDGVIRANQHVTPYRREAYLHWVNTGRHAGSKPDFTSQGTE